MKTIGLTGGSTLCELGPTTEVQMFFDCLRMYVVQRRPDLNWALLTDRLYRRYLRLDELDVASELMGQAKQEFSSVTNQAIDWRNMSDGFATNRLEMKGCLAETFDRFFESFTHCVESAKINYEGFKSYPGYKYEAVRLVVADMPEFLADKKRPLEEYDALEGEPFWLR